MSFLLFFFFSFLVLASTLERRTRPSHILSVHLPLSMASLGRTTAAVDELAGRKSQSSKKAKRTES